MKFLLLFCISAIFGCAHLKEEYREKELRKIIAEFNQVAVDCKVAVKIPLVEFINVNKKFKYKENLAGVCYKGVIFLDEMWWSRAYSLDRQQVVFHELGHCALGLKHGNNLMDTKKIENSLFLEKKQEYIKELFQKKQKCN